MRREDVIQTRSAQDRLMEIDSDDISASRCHHVEYVIRFIKMIEELRDKGDIENKNRKIGRVDCIGVFLRVAFWQPI